MLEAWVAWSVCLPICYSKFIHAWIWDCPVTQTPPCHMSSLPQLPLSPTSTSLNEYFFINSLVVGLLCSSIFCQFWLFFVFIFLLSFFWLCEGAKHIYLCLLVDWQSQHVNFKGTHFSPYNADESSKWTSIADNITNRWEDVMSLVKVNKTKLMPNIMMKLINPLDLLIYKNIMDRETY